MLFCYITRVKDIGKNIIDGFKNPQDIKNLFGGNVDFVGQQVVFDVGGNKVRTITKIE